MKRRPRRLRERMAIDDEPWYRTAVIYSIDVRRFADSNGDGIGDLRGLIGRLDYLAELGVDCLWLLPIFPSPWRDNGYDVCDYLAVDPSIGTLDDFQELTAAASRRGLRVIVDAVLNHTSDRHPWFIAARRDAGSIFRSYYRFTEGEPPMPEGVEPAFPGHEERIWTWDEVAKAHYYHRFYSFQPDLDFANPMVMHEARKVLDFWLSLGASGFRVDAVSPLIEDDIAHGREPRHEHEILKELHGFVAARVPDAALVGEVDVPPEMLNHFFGEGDELHMIFNFVLNPRLLLALARASAEPIREAFELAPPPPGRCQWVVFLRSHDEASFAQLSEPEREEAMRAYGSDERMRIFERGVRRRLAPMLGGDAERVALAFALMLSLPGTPMIFYGDEIGMGEDLERHGRDAVRVPMQWSGEAHAGFSSAPAERLLQPVVADGPFSFERVNVAAQLGRDGSLLERVREMLQARRRAPELAVGVWSLLDAGDDGVLAACSEYAGRRVVSVVNLAREPRTVTLGLEGAVEPLLGPPPAAAGEGRMRVALPASGACWFRLR